MNILIMGSDITAWTQAAVLASSGCQVSLLLDQNVEVESSEPQLSRLVQTQQDEGRLQVIQGASLNEPQTNLLIDARVNLDFDSRKQAIEQFAACLPQAQSVVVALVQPVEIGTTEQLQQRLNDQGLTQLSVVYWPSFIQSGRAIDSFSRSDRILLGSHHPKAVLLIKRLLTPFNRSLDSFMLMQPKEAELTKVAINGMLATRVSFMNELARFASLNQIDIEPVRQGIGSDSRIGFQYLYPGCGFGGDAFLQTLQQLTQALGRDYQPDLLSVVCSINEQQKDLLFQKFWRFYQADVQQRTVAIWGGAFKPNSSDISGSPALVLIESLLAHCVSIRLYDPAAAEALRDHFSNHSKSSQLTFCESALIAAEEVDAIMLVTEWKEFWNIDLAALQQKVKQPLLLDGRNIYDPAYAQQSGWIYSGIGRGQAL